MREVAASVVRVSPAVPTRSGEGLGLPAPEQGAGAVSGVGDVSGRM